MSNFFDFFAFFYNLSGLYGISKYESDYIYTLFKIISRKFASILSYSFDMPDICCDNILYPRQNQKRLFEAKKIL